MPLLTAADHQNILSVVQSTFNGDTSVLVPSAQAFYVPGTSVPLTLKYDGFVTKRGTLSALCPVSGAIVTLQSASEASQFRAGDVCYLVGNAFAGAVNANDNEADQVTVVSVSASNQTVTVTGRAASAYAAGSSLVVVDDGQPGGFAGTTSDGPPVGNQAMGELLAALETSCTPAATTALTGVGTTTRLDFPTGGGGFSEEGSLEGATVEMTTAAAAALQGCTAVVGSVVINGIQTELTLRDLKDNTGATVAAWPSAPQAADQATVTLDLTNGKLTPLREAGGDMSTLVAALLTMHRKLDELPATSPEIPLVNEWRVWGQKTGPILRLKMPEGRASGDAYTDATDTSITVEMDPAVGDIPIPLSGLLRVVNAQDGVGSDAWNAASTSLPASGAYVAYTRQKRSNVLDLGAALVLGADIPGISGVGRMVEIDGGSSGFATNSGFSPEAANKYFSGLLYQLINAVNAYVVLGS